MDQTTVAVVLARADSTRLPGKVLRAVGGTTLLDCVVDRLLRASCLDDVVVATTARDVDEPIEHWARTRDLRIHRGATHDVATRFVDAAEAAGAQWAFRVNADSPFVDPHLLDEAALLRGETVDLISNLHPRTHPYGLAVELVRVRRLRELLGGGGLSMEDREHVTRGLYRLLPPSRIASVARPDFATPDGLRLVVDDERDLVAFSGVVDRLGERLAAASSPEVVAAYQAVDVR